LPKSQFQNFGSPVEASLKSTISVAHPVAAVDVKAATGAWLFPIKQLNIKPVKIILRINSICFRSQKFITVFEHFLLSCECTLARQTLNQPFHLPLAKTSVFKGKGNPEADAGVTQFPA
jgi:hypothetical protein